MHTISKITFRRFLLGAQGLWPRRRFSTVEAALNEMQALQLDIRTVVAGHWSPVHGPELIDDYLNLLIEN